MRTKDLVDMIHRLEHIKSNAHTSQEIITTLEDIKENLHYLEAEVKNKRNPSFALNLFDYFSHKIPFLM